MNSSTIGTHVSHGRHARGAHAAGGSQKQAPSPERASAAKRGNDVRQSYLSHMGTSATSGEDDAAYSRRVMQGSYVQALQRRVRRRRIFVIVLLAVLVVAVAVVVGVATYFNSTNTKLSRGLSDAEDALVKPKTDSPYYVLCTAELGSAGRMQGNETDAFLLMRIDENACTLTFVSIPANLDVRLSDGKKHPLYEALDLGGETELIERVADLTDVDIAHFVTTDADGLAGMVDELGGIDVDVPLEVDDPYAGTKVLRMGEQTLDGQTSLVFLRATNFQNGIEATSANRALFMCDFLRTALAPGGAGLATLVGEAGSYLSTDFTSSQLLSLGDTFNEFDEATIYSCMVPCSKSEDDESLYEISEDAWESMANLIRTGKDPTPEDDSTDDVVPSEVTVEVRNGADVTGAAATATSLLEDEGFVVNGTGNVDDGTEYPETLVIYDSPNYENAAKVIMETLDADRIVDGGDYYTFDTHVLVIIGADWLPPS